MKIERKKFICLKTLAVRARRLRKNLKQQPEALMGAAQMADVPAAEITELLDQIIGRKKPTLPHEKCLEIAWILAKVAVSETFLHDGFAVVLENLHKVEEESGISEKELREFFLGMIYEIAKELFTS